MRQVLCPVLVGREEELRVLLEALDGAVAGRGTTVVVTGEAGAGKSRLVRELSGKARERGLPVLTGRAAGGAVPVPFRPLAEAVLGELRRGGLPDLPELRPFRPALGRLVPEWQPREPLGGAGSLVVLGEGVLRLLRALAGDRGCLLVLEDLHGADPETLAVLEYLADNLAGERVLCLATLRPEEGAAGRELAAALPPAVESWRGASADGLPFLVEELLAGLLGAALLVEEDGRWSTTGPLGAHVPPTFADAVGRRLEALSPPARDLLGAAAVLGRWSPGTASSPGGRPPRRPWPTAGASRWPGCGRRPGSSPPAATSGPPPPAGRRCAGPAPPSPGPDGATRRSRPACGPSG